MTTAPTLYTVHERLFELYERRQELMDECLVTEAAEEDRRIAVRKCDQDISEQLGALDNKVDRVAGFIREMTSRAEIHEKEAKRVLELARREKAVAEETKQRGAETIASRLDPAVIAGAHQNEVLVRLNGSSSTLKLCKSAASVEVTDMSLLPDEYQNVTITIPVKVWREIEGEMYGVAAPDRPEPQPDKRAIAAVLKTVVVCEMCYGSGIVESACEGVPGDTCSRCAGSGKQRATAPGARLVNDSVHLRVS